MTFGCLNLSIRRAWTARTVGSIVLAGFFLSLGAGSAAAQVSIFLKAGSSGRSPVRGEISGMSPDSITVKTDGGPVEVDVATLRSIAYSQPPTELSRINNRYAAMQFDEGLDELAKMEGKASSADLEHELAYLKALGNAESALNGGRVTPQIAGQEVTAFFRAYPRSFYSWPLTERLGKLLIAVGRNDLAQAEFAKLVNSTSPEYQVKGNFHVALAQLVANDGAGAEASLARVIGSPVDTDEVRELKSRARAMQARALAITGRTAEARAAAEKLIAAENPDNSALFAEAYNTLGVCHFQEGDMKAAALAFLHTDLLFFNQSESHAEALWYLAQIWPRLDKPDAGFEAQENLRRLYKNSSWTAKLGQ